jgi:hypothetical protein
MMKSKILISLVSLALIGCAVVNVYVTFPEKEIEEAAEDILAPPAESSASQSILNMVFTREAYAQEVKRSLVTDSPVIDEAAKKRNSWLSEINKFKKEGFLGETNDFRIVLKNTPGTSEVIREVNELKDKENRQREIIIKELLNINNAAPSQEDKFRRIFSRVAQKYSPAGTWIQEPSGQWKKK